MTKEYTWGQVRFPDRRVKYCLYDKETHTCKRWLYDSLDQALEGSPPLTADEGESDVIIFVNEDGGSYWHGKASPAAIHTGRSPYEATIEMAGRPAWAVPLDGEALPIKH